MAGKEEGNRSVIDTGDFKGRLGPWGPVAAARTGARTHGLMRHDLMDWTVGANWTVGIDSRRLGLIGD